MNDATGTGPFWTPLEPLLADDFFFAAHDDVNGRLRLTARGASIGLAAALLGELILFRKIILRDAHVVAVDRRPVPDALANLVLEDVLGEQEARPVRDWVRFLARRSYELVAQRMVRKNLLRVVDNRRFRRSPAYRAVDTNTAAWPVVRLAQKLARDESVVLPDAVLAGLVRATGLQRYLRTDAAVDVGEHLRHLVTGLPPPLHGLVAEVEAAIGEAAMRPTI